MGYFQDDPDGSRLWSYFPTLLSVLGGLFAANAGIGAIFIDSCSQISSYLLAGGAVMAVGTACLYALRFRQDSLHTPIIMIKWVACLILSMVGSLSIFFYSIYAIKEIHESSSAICTSNKLRVPAILQVTFTFLATFLYIPTAMLIIYNRVVFMKPTIWWEDYKNKLDNMRWLRTTMGDVIPVYFIRPSQTVTPRFVLIYSHGNASDMGVVLSGLTHLARYLSCIVITYDYPGYGLAGTGVLNETRIFAAIDAVWRSVVSPVNGFYGSGTLPKHVFLYGRSLGTGVSTYLAALLGDQYEYDELLRSRAPGALLPPAPRYIERGDVKGAHRLAGLILDSPFMSILRTKFNFSKTISLDMFASIDRMPRIRVPVLISHGMLDTVVPIAHPQALLEALPERFRYTPDFQPTKGHNDMPKYWLYSLSAEKDPEARKKLEQTNKENKECIEKLKEFTSACMVRIYESPGSSSEDEPIIHRDRGDEKDSDKQAARLSDQETKSQAGSVKDKSSHKSTRISSPQTSNTRPLNTSLGQPAEGPIIIGLGAAAGAGAGPSSVAGSPVVGVGAGGGDSSADDDPNGAPHTTRREPSTRRSSKIRNNTGAGDAALALGRIGTDKSMRSSFVGTTSSSLPGSEAVPTASAIKLRAEFKAPEISDEDEDDADAEDNEDADNDDEDDRAVDLEAGSFKGVVPKQAPTGASKGNTKSGKKGSKSINRGSYGPSEQVSGVVAQRADLASVALMLATSLQDQQQIQQQQQQVQVQQLQLQQQLAERNNEQAPINGSSISSSTSSGSTGVISIQVRSSPEFDSNSNRST